MEEGSYPWNERKLDNLSITVSSKYNLIISLKNKTKSKRKKINKIPLIDIKR